MDPLSASPRPRALLPKRSWASAWRRLAPAGSLLLAWAVIGCRAAPSADVPPESAAVATAAPAELVSPMGPSQIPTAEARGPASPAAPACELRATFLEDLAIADNTPLPPSTPFTKSWRLRNDGSCVWDEAYRLTFIGGDRMDAAHTLPLLHTVLPGGTVDLAVDLIAPGQPGSFQGFWKLQDAQGHLFGVGGEGNLSLWVMIEVQAELAADGSASSIPEEPEGEAIAPAVLVSGRAAIPPGIAFDLDHGEAQADEGVDIVWQGELASQGSARIGPAVPTTDAAAPGCDGERLSNASIAQADLPPGAVVCYRTDQGRAGFLTIVEAGEALRFDYITWQESFE